ncbi:hypothetical protein [Aestuariivirga sp.]|uniref:hypothetical protein n=1 Tax=Aestuariivirga sp. TaxID=2650926 RepID=UPI0039E2D251
MFENSSGVLFVVTGAHWTQSATDAARSVVQSNPWLKIGIFTDQQDVDPLFHFVGRIHAGESRRKHEYVGRSPFSRTLYLDSDVRVTGDLHDLFRLLENYDIAGTHVRYRTSPRRLNKYKIDIPQAFPQINCGVLLYRKSDATERLFRSWITLYNEGGFTRDQIPFREALWTSDARFYAFAPEYNTRRIPIWPNKGPLPVILHINALHSPKAWKRKLTHLLLMPVMARIRRFQKYGHPPVPPAPR